MLNTNELVNIFLPVFNHWILWLSFLVIIIIVLILYAYPYLKKPRKEFRSYHVGIPIANIVSLYIFTKMLEGFIYQGAILKVDAWFNEAMLTLHSTFLTKLSFFITSFGSGIPIVILSTLAIGVLLLRKRWRYALISLIAILSTTLLQVTIKNLVHRARPLNSLEVIAPGAFSGSFPSGHTITSIVFVSLLVYSYKEDIKHVIIKYLSIIIVSVFFVSVGLSRIYLNAHWFSDVLAGMSLGLFWFMTVVLVERSISGLIPAVKKETREAEPIKAKEVVKVVKKIVPEVLKT